MKKNHHHILPEWAIRKICTDNSSTSLKVIYKDAQDVKEKIQYVNRILNQRPLSLNKPTSFKWDHTLSVVNAFSFNDLEKIKDDSIETDIFSIDGEIKSIVDNIEKFDNYQLSSLEKSQVLSFMFTLHIRFKWTCNVKQNFISELREKEYLVKKIIPNFQKSQLLTGLYSDFGVAHSLIYSFKEMLNNFSGNKTIKVIKVNCDEDFITGNNFIHCISKSGQFGSLDTLHFKQIGALGCVVSKNIFLLVMNSSCEFNYTDKNFVRLINYATLQNSNVVFGSNMDLRYGYLFKKQFLHKKIKYPRTISNYGYRLYKDFKKIKVKLKKYKRYISYVEKDYDPNNGSDIEKAFLAKIDVVHNKLISIRETIFEVSPYNSIRDYNNTIEMDKFIFNSSIDFLKMFIKNYAIITTSFGVYDLIRYCSLLYPYPCVDCPMPAIYTENFDAITHKVLIVSKCGHLLFGLLVYKITKEDSNTVSRRYSIIHQPLNNRIIDQRKGWIILPEAKGALDTYYKIFILECEKRKKDLFTRLEYMASHPKIFAFQLSKELLPTPTP